MSADNVTNPPTATQSKSARKKKAKAEAAATGASTVDSPSVDSSAETKLNGHDTSSENAFVKELQKNLRNVNKKLSLMNKVDAIVAENPDTPLEELVASRKINQDQKAQILKKPGLQAQAKQYEDQLTQYKKFDEEYRSLIAKEKETLQSAHSTELEKLRDTLKAEAAIELQQALRDRLLTLSRFLKAAATRRQNQDDGSDLSKGFEGALLLVYGGDAAAVAAAEKLIEGTDDPLTSTEGQLLSVTYKQIKEAALEETPVDEMVTPEAPEAPEPTEAGASQVEPQGMSSISTDPTVALAGLTEVDDNTTVAITSAGDDIVDTSTAPPAASIDSAAANSAAEDQWDNKASASDDPLAESYEIIPRNPSETETGGVPAPSTSIQSWADETSDMAQSTSEPTATLPSNGNDGFHEVHHNRGGRARGGPQGEHRGGYRGRGGPRGEGRGRGGFRGDRGGEGGYRGRGRGGYRGGRGRGDSNQN
ncbi:hypothetical protein M501DRAFT_938578 [Patellaria atrata CBS 101060]|uniref:YAG7-like dimerisation domain-containing protein n=1 Tax=Patellaria atrata CBS 101060 TaxID=1346257 RepID=A0A9P4VQV6_9PEZI|nr:hypothetical protein M501DRAFT_938578 [Patellaria atrata CBS 101060]